jgi:hypothetical protein
MAGENDHVVFPSYRDCWFLFLRSAVEENEFNAGQRVSVSSVPDFSASSWFRVRNYDSLRATAEPR